MQQLQIRYPSSVQFIKILPEAK